MVRFFWSLARKASCRLRYRFEPPPGGEVAGGGGGDVLDTQAHVLDLLVDIQRRTGVACLFISQDLAVIRHISRRVSVIHRGDI